MNNEVWYSEMVGQTFNGYTFPGSPYIWFSRQLFFYDTDIEVLNKEANGNLPQFGHGFC